MIGNDILGIIRVTVATRGSPGLALHIVAGGECEWTNPRYHVYKQTYIAGTSTSSSDITMVGSAEFKMRIRLGSM